MPGTSLTTAQNNVINRFKGAEQKTQWAIIGLLGVGAFVFSVPLLAFVERVRAIVENTLSFGAECLLGAAVLYLLFDPKFRNILGGFYRMGIRAVTSFFIRMDPIGVLEDRVKEILRNVARFMDSMAKLLAQINSLKKDIEENDEVIQKALTQIAYLQKHGRMNESEFQLAVSREKSTRESNDRLMKLLARLERTYAILEALKKLADSVCEDTIFKVNLKKKEDKASKAGFAALSSAISVIRDNSSSKENYDKAMEMLGDDLEYRMGAIEEFTKSCDGLLQTIAMNDEIAADEAIKNLEHMQSKVLGNSSSSDNIIDVSATVVRTSERVPVGRSNSLLLDDDQPTKTRR